MAVKKVLIDDILDVYNNYWPGKDWYMEDAHAGWEDQNYGGKYVRYEENSTIAVNPGEMVNPGLFDGYIVWQGSGEEPANRGPVPTTFLKLFNQIQSSKTHVKFYVEVPKDKQEEFVAMSKQLGVKF